MVKRGMTQTLTDHVFLITLNQQRNNYFTASFNAFPAPNLGALPSAIWISSPPFPEQTKGL